VKAGRPRNKTAPRFCLGTFRRKNRGGELTRAATLASCSGRFALFQSFISLTGFSSHFGARSAKVFPISIGLSAMTPNPTHRFMPASPRYRQRFNPCRRLTTLIRPSDPVRQACACRNHLFFCNARHSVLLVEGCGMANRLTPILWAASSIFGPIEGRVGSDQARSMSELLLVNFDGFQSVTDWSRRDVHHRLRDA